MSSCDDNIKNNIERCARCALCVQNCPIWDITKDENNTARGLICKLSGYEKKYLNVDDIKKDFKICLNCSKCKTNCPSKVDTTGIFAYKNALFSPSKISQRIVLALKFLPVKIVYFLNFLRITKIKNPSSNILYFKGCMAQAQHKTTFLDTLYSKADFLCCGLPYLAGGDLKNYEKAKKKNIELIKKAKYVVFDCASCKSAVEDYFEADSDERKKLFFFSDFLKKYKLKENSKFKGKTVSFHKPCHMSKDDFLKIENFLSSIQNINYVSLENPDSCCGFGGSYFLFHPVISTKIVLKKAKTIKSDLVLTSCPSCTLGLRYGQFITLKFKKVMELRDFIENELVEIKD